MRFVAQIESFSDRKIKLSVAGKDEIARKAIVSLGTNEPYFKIHKQR